MRFVFFVHSVVSDWNHGNAHFLRGLMSALVRMGHSVRSFEPQGAWSVENLIADHGVRPVVEFARAYPGIDVQTYDENDDSLDEAIQAAADADVVIVHEWNTQRLADAVLRVRRRHSHFLLLFHDTHHRAWSDPEAIDRLGPASYDGVLAFADVLRRIYVERWKVEHAWTFHEAADTAQFHPRVRPVEQDVVWIGNWGDEERTGELDRFWLASARALPELRFVAHGVRYPERALEELSAAGIEFRGWAPSLKVPEIFAASRVTLHVPRRAYVEALPGIPTIRVFEALACGIPLVSTPWNDAEGLFRAGDYRVAATPEQMINALRRLAADADLRESQAARGLETILARHTCDHRAAELLDIVLRLGRAGSAGAPPATEAICA